jgi:hypothetical protein
MMAASFSVPNLYARVGDREEVVVVAICVPLESKRNWLRTRRHGEEVHLCSMM